MEHIIRVGKGYLFSFIAFGLLSFLGAVILRLTPFPERWSFFYLLAAMTAVCFFTGLYMAGWFRRAGILTGLLFSAGLLFLIIMMTALSFSTFFSLQMIHPLYLVPLGAGALGGIIGANLRQ